MWGPARPSVLVAQQVARQRVQAAARREARQQVQQQRARVVRVAAEVVAQRRQERQRARVALAVVGVAAQQVRAAVQHRGPARQWVQQRRMQRHRSHQLRRANHPRRRPHQLARQFLTMFQKQEPEFQCLPCQSRSLPAAHQPK
jgi:hypothetical protein